MDPAAALARIRELAASLLADPDGFSLADAHELAETFHALDAWRLDGGFDPWATAAGYGFALAITLGNDAMQTPVDVADAIERVRQALYCESATTGAVRDVNGNTVGRWTFEAEPAPRYAPVEKPDADDYDGFAR